MSTSTKNVGYVDLCMPLGGQKLEKIKFLILDSCTFFCIRLISCCFCYFKRFTYMKRRVIHLSFDTKFT